MESALPGLIGTDSCPDVFLLGCAKYPVVADSLAYAAKRNLPRCDDVAFRIAVLHRNEHAHRFVVGAFTDRREYALMGCRRLAANREGQHPPRGLTGILTFDLGPVRQFDQCLTPCL